MRCPARPLLSALLLLCVAAGLLQAAPAAAAGDPGAEIALALLADRDRGAAGLPALRVCAELREVARRWSERMAAEGRLAHNPALEREVSGWRSLGENVAYNVSAERVHDGLASSAAHREHLLAPRFRELGVGATVRDGRVWVTQVFREPDGTQACTVVPVDDRITTACPPGRVPAGAFPDVRGNGHGEAVDCLLWYSVASGTSAATYSPASPVSRAQAASFLTRLIARAGVALPEPRDQGFTDVGGSPHADAINQLVELGIAEGTTPTTYSPDTAVSRGQLATLLVAAHEHASGELLGASRDWFADDAGLVHEDAINAAASADFVAGIAERRYAPQRELRRDQLASALARVLDRLAVRGRLTPPA